MKYKINKGFIAQKLGDKTTIFDGEESVLYTFNKTGTLIFDKLKLGWDAEKIISLMVKTYDIPLVKAKNDLNDFTKELLKSKVIVKS